MKIVAEFCVGCEKCIPFCPTDAISMKENKAVIDDAKCVECYSCHRAAPCPKIGCFEPASLRYEDPDQKQSRKSLMFRRPDNIPIAKSVIGLGEFLIIQDVVCETNPRVACPDGWVGFTIELGRPHYPTPLKEAKTICEALSEVAGKIQVANRADPFLFKLADLINNDLPENDPFLELLEAKVFPTMEIGFKIPEQKLPKALKILRETFEKLETPVMSISLLQKVKPDGTVPILKVLDDLGIGYKRWGEVNIGIASADRQR